MMQNREKLKLVTHKYRKKIDSKFYFMLSTDCRLSKKTWKAFLPSDWEKESKIKALLLKFNISSVYSITSLTLLFINEFS